MPALSSRFLIAACFVVILFVSRCRDQPMAEVNEEVATKEIDDGVMEVTSEVVTRIVPEVVTTAPVEVTRSMEQIIEVTAVPTLEPALPKMLTICMVNEPASLYIYANPLVGPPNLAKQAVLHAIYENLYTTLSFEYQAQGLIKLPNIEDGDAEIKRVSVNAGDLVIDINGEVVQLEEGVTIKDADGEAIEFDGSPMDMAQMVVRFRLLPMVWSDGTTVTAADSLFSFEVAADPDTPTDKSTIERTASYQALDDETIQWTGLPGWLDPDYFTNIWPPLPAHQLSRYPIAQLAETAEVMETPLSNGPFVIEEWVKGDHILMVKNEHYFRAEEGFPRVDMIKYQFVENGNQLVALILAGECDIAAQDGLDMSQAPLLLEAEANGLGSSYFESNNIFEHIDFGINSEESYAAVRPDWFEDERVRQAMMMCTDRQAMVDTIFLGLTQIAHAYIPSTHPLYPTDITEWAYDVTAANDLLDQVGYLDNDGDGIREDISTQQPFSITLSIGGGNPTREQIAQMFKGNMVDCGIEVEVQPQLSADLFSPTGVLFGRRFDLVQFPWITGFTPACHLYTTSEIPTEGNKWQGVNETGWSNPFYDNACETARDSLVGTEGYRVNHQEALRIFSQQLPVIPLFSYLKIAAARPEVINFQLDPTQPSEFWNLYEIDLQVISPDP